MTDLLRQLEAALAARNPGLVAALQPPLTADDIRKPLSRLGVKDHIDPVLALYTWHNGALVSENQEAFKLGIAPPVISTLPKDRVEFMQGLGHKFDPNAKIYDPFNFFKFDHGIFHLKLWKKFSTSLPDSAALAGRFFPFLSNKSGDSLAVDLMPETHGRVVLIAQDKHVRTAYDSFEMLLKDLIHANQTNELLTCVQSPGQPITLPPPPPPKPSKKPSAPTLPLTDNAFLLRTDFSDDAAWSALQTAIQSHATDESPTLDFINDPTFASTPPEKICSLLPTHSNPSFAFVADQTTLSSREHLVLVVDLSKKKPKTFRVSPAHLAEVSSNLSLANMEFSDFAKASKSDGIFRGFPDAE